MALTPFEEKLVSNYMDATYPQPEPEPAPEQASMDGVQLAAGPSPVVSDAGAAFGVYPGMGKRSQRSDIGERMITGAPDFAAGAARGATTAALGLGGDIQTLGRFIAALATDDQGGGIMDKLGRAAQTMSLPTLLPTSENLSQGGYTIPGTSITLPGLPSAVPAGQGGFGMTPEQRQSAAGAGQFAGELVGDPVMFAKAGQVAAKAVKATKGMPVGMSTQAVGGMDGVLKPQQALKSVNVGDKVDGRTVLDGVPNMSSIGASLDEYTIVEGIKEIPLSAFDNEYVSSIKAENLDKRTKELAAAIKKSKQITPLIVVADSNGFYVLEGGHRFDALIASKAKSLPAVVVIDESDKPSEAVLKGLK